MSARLGDYIQEGNLADLSAALRKQIESLEEKASEIWKQTHLGDACRVFPALLRCTARQLLILDKCHDLPVEVAAGACRTTFETNIRVRLATTDPAYLMKFQLEFVGDEQSLINAFIKLADPSTNSPARATLDKRLQEIEAVLNRRGLVSVNRPPNVSDNAKSAGVLSEYDSMYRFYSKYVHASGWLVLATDERRDSDDHRKILQVMTQVYAVDTLSRISKAYEQMRVRLASSLSTNG